jgi:pyruvate formate lyase activating enzyme
MHGRFYKIQLQGDRAMIKRALLYQTLRDKQVHCYLCNHHCRIADTEFGFCGVRENKNGDLYTHAYGEVVAAHVDPIEKKPLFHVLPGSTAFSIATAGCNFQCGFCQNWQISQKSQETRNDCDGTPLPPKEIVRQAKQNGCASIAYTYTEPTIFFEYAYDTAQLARKEGMLNVFVTNGYMTEQALEVICPYLDACNVDLKSFSEEFYSDICRGHLKPVLESIRFMKKRGIWVEITTLVIPGVNDSEDNLMSIARFIASIDRAIPWHISRFHPDYQFTESASTPLAILEMARDIGTCEGLHHVYIGNVAGEEENTLCEHCNEAVIQRQAFIIKKNALKGKQCPYCGKDVSGIFCAEAYQKKMNMKKRKVQEHHAHGSP